jgi:hypothetical protein
VRHRELGRNRRNNAPQRHVLAFKPIELRRSRVGRRA